MGGKEVFPHPGVIDIYIYVNTDAFLVRTFGLSLWKERQGAADAFR